MAVGAARAGARVPGVIGTGTSRHGAGLLLQEWVDGKPLGAALTERDHAVSQLLADVWSQVAILNRGRIAHGALTEQHLMVDGRGRVHVVGFADAQTAGTADDLAADIAQVLVTTATLAGAQAAVSVARAELGDAAVMAAIDFLGSGRGRRRSRSRVGGHPGGGGVVSLDALRAAAGMTTRSPGRSDRSG